MHHYPVCVCMWWRDVFFYLMRLERVLLKLQWSEDTLAVLFGLRADWWLMYLSTLDRGLGSTFPAGFLNDNICLERQWTSFYIISMLNLPNNFPKAIIFTHFMCYITMPHNPFASVWNTNTESNTWGMRLYMNMKDIVNCNEQEWYL